MDLATVAPCEALPLRPYVLAAWYLALTCTMWVTGVNCIPLYQTAGLLAGLPALRSAATAATTPAASKPSPAAAAT